MRTFCDYLVIEAANKSKQAVDCVNIKTKSEYQE